jgi:farnesyl-diphosphate farnesyltransferase
MNRSDLGGPLLASVSRSFYLTIRLLPEPLRAPIGLAYLLARASDTIADSEAAPVPVRRGHLAAFDAMIARGSADGLAALQHDIQPTHAGERELIARLAECLEALAAQGALERREIVRVLGKIIRGQTLDLERFADPAQIVALPDSSALETYTYLVAGCVGEFWTRLCLAHCVPCFHPWAAEREMERHGMRYGQGLQLVNILRDLPADLRAGRCYLPGDELRAAGVDPAALPASPALAQPVFDRWLARAERHLDDGLRYLRALRSPRLRAGVFLPWRLGVQTLALLRTQNPLTAPQRLKVPRSAVRAALLRAVPAAFSNHALPRADSCGGVDRERWRA